MASDDDFAKTVQDMNDDLALQEALKASLKSSKHQNHGAEAIHPQMEVFTLYQSNELSFLEAADANTLVVIGVPPQQRDQSVNAYAAIKRHFTRTYKIHSDNLLRLNSAKFNELLGATSQFRTERRLRNEGILPGGKPRGIKYLLDLRPPTEGDEASFLLIDLSCSSGVLTWFLAQEKYGIPQTLVGGQDDSSLLPSPMSPMIDSNHVRNPPTAEKNESPPAADAHPWPFERGTTGESDQNTEPKKPRKGNWEGVFPRAMVAKDEASEKEAPGDAINDTSSDEGEPQASPNAATNAWTSQGPKVQRDYSQLRHYSAIERLLHAIEGQDPMLDSAPKMWTFFAIAKYFDCANHKQISEWITKWLFTAPNHYFIQCNPEVCYRIGHGIQSEALLKVAFSLLVGEKSLMSVWRQNKHYSVAGRKLDSLDDDELNRIDHATHVFMRRTQAKYDALIGEDMVWLERSDIFLVLARFNVRSLREEHVVQELKERIKMFVRVRVLWVLARNYDGDWPEMESVPESVRPFYPHSVSPSSVYSNLSEEERIFTRFFWMALKEEHLELGDKATFTPRGKAGRADGEVSPALGWSKLAIQSRPKFSRRNMFEVDREVLREWGASFVRIFRERGARSKADMFRDLPDDEAGDAGIRAKSSGGKTCLGMHTGPGGLLSHPLADPSTLEQLSNLHLSSPKRSHGRSPTPDFSTRKRPCLGADNTPDESEQPLGQTSNLPIRAAKPVPGAKGETIGCRKQESRRLKRVQQYLLAGALQPDFPIYEMLVELSYAVHKLCDEVLFAPHFFQDDVVPPTCLIDTLMCLSEAEWTYLPLWAGGNDDGSGGVFEDGEIPNLERGGFAGGKRGLTHEGNHSFSDESDWSDAASTVAKASKEATDGTATGTGTVQSLGDVDMDVQSVDDESIACGAETMAGLSTCSVHDLGDEEETEHLYGDEDEVKDESAELEDSEEEDSEEAGWDDCDM